MLGSASVFQGDVAGGFSQLEDLSRRFRLVGRKQLYAFTEHAIGSEYFQMAYGREISAGRPLFGQGRQEEHLNRTSDVAQEIGAKETLGAACFDLDRLHMAMHREGQVRERISKAIDLYEMCELEASLKVAREVLASSE